MADRDFQWFLQHADAYNSLSVEQLHTLGQGGTIDWEGEVASTSVETPPTATDGASATPAPAAAPAAEPVSSAELDAAMARTKELETLANQQAEMIKSLQAAKTADDQTGGTQAQEDVLADFRKTFPEIADTLEPALKAVIAKGIELNNAEWQKKFDSALQPLQQTAMDVQETAHFQKITDAIPDFETIRDSGEVEKWIETLPSYAKNPAKSILAEGTADEVIELFTQYKSSLGKPADTPALSKAEIEKKAAEAVAKAKGVTPVSSTDIPASSTQTHTEEPTTMQGWSEKFAKMSPEQIMKSL